MSTQDDQADDLSRCESMAQMVFDREWAEHVGKGPVSTKVEAAFTQLHNELHTAEKVKKVAVETTIGTEDNLHKAAKILAEMRPQTKQSQEFLAFYHAIYDTDEDPVFVQEDVPH